MGRKAPADWARMLLGDLESLRNACPLFRNLGDPSIDWERWRALIVTPVGDRAMRLSQTYETNWHETPCIKTVDLSCTHVADLPAGVLLWPECPHECVRVFTSDTEQWQETSSVTSNAQRVVRYLVHAPWRLNTCSAVHSDVGENCWMAYNPDPQQQW